MQISIENPSVYYDPKSQKLQILLFVIILNFGSFVIGYLMVMHNKSSYPSYLTTLNIENSCTTRCLMDSYVLLTSALPIGAIFGIFASIPISFYYGRRFTIIKSDILAIFAFFIMLPIKYMIANIIAQFMFGVYCGINFSIINIFSYEMLKLSNYTQNYLILQPFFFNFGSFIGLIGFHINYDLYIIVSICTARLTIMLFWLKYESPIYLAHRKPEALVLLSCQMISDEAKAQDFQQQIMHYPTFYSKDFEIIDVFLKPYGLYLFLGILLCVFHQISGNSLFLFYSSQISNLFGLLVSAICLIASIASFFILKIIHSHRKILFFTSPFILTMLLFQYLGFGRNCTFGMNLLNIILFISFQWSSGTVLQLILVKILPDIGIILSTVGYWGVAFVLSLSVDLENTDIYYGGSYLFLVLLILGIIIYLILFRFLKETKIHLI